MSWFTESNRWKHFLGGIIVGILSLGDYYCAVVSGIGIASALELKDKLWEGKWDWIDWGITVIGVLIGYIISFTFKTYLV